MARVVRLFQTPSGTPVEFVATDNITKPGSLGIDKVDKHCSVCGTRHHFLDFLTQTRTDSKGYLRIEGRDGEDHQKCKRHYPPIVVPLPAKGERLKVRVGNLRDDRGQPIDVWDRKCGCWRAMGNVGVRRMKPDGSRLAFQPTGNRSHAADGRKYGTAA